MSRFYHVMHGCVGAICLVSTLGVLGASSAEEIARKVDELYRSKTSYAELSMEIVTPHWQRTLDMKAWSRGMDQTFIRILSPRKERGVGTLRIDTEMWNYLPRTGKVIKIPPSMMMSAWMGSDFTNDDLVKEFTLTKHYTFKLLEPEDREAGLLYLEARPKPDVPVVWDRILIVVQETGLLPVRQMYFDEKGQLMRQMVFTEITQFGQRRVPAVMTLTPATKEGHRTVIRYKDLRFDLDLKPDVFSLRNLRQPLEK